MPVLPCMSIKKTHHLRRSIRSLRIGIRTGLAAAGPRMTGTMIHPVFCQDLFLGIELNGLRVGTAIDCIALNLARLHLLKVDPFAGCGRALRQHFGAVAGMSRMVAISMK